MEYIQTDDSFIKYRTKRTKKIYSLLLLVFAVVFHVPNIHSAHIDFDDVETAWLKNIVVRTLPRSIGDDVGGEPTIHVKIIGLTNDEIEAGVRFQPSLSPDKCTGNEFDLKIVNDMPFTNGVNQTTDLIVAVNKIHFKNSSTVYLCIKSVFSSYFQSLGEQSKLKM